LEDKRLKAKYRMYLKGELEAAAMYGAMADAERDSERAEVFQHLVEAEMRHASKWAQKLGIAPDSLRPPRWGLRMYAFKWIAKGFGTNRIVPLLLRGEAKDIRAYSLDPEGRDLVMDERSHGRTLLGLAGIQDPVEIIRAESGHYTGGGGSLRAAVMGINDGLVSNFSLVMGVAGGTGDADIVLLAGVAGLMAGAFSMASGEYVSVRSQRDMYEHQIGLERAEIEMWPEEEEEELFYLYQAKGLTPKEARLISKRVMADPEVALDTMAREELGLDPSQLGSPWGAAISSFSAFVAGAIVPIIPYILDAGRLSFSLSGILSGGALISVGSLIAWMTGRSVIWGSLRMFMAGSAAALVTFAVGSLIGVAMS
jgi:VIT1/CCC1 family predicted Fe2+/Mn2+ transporter